MSDQPLLSNRRDVLKGLTCLGGVLLTRPSLAGVLLHSIGDKANAASASSPPQDSFRGTMAGDERVVNGIRFCWCPAGTFNMGSPLSEVGRRPDEAQVAVTLTRGYWISKFEITQSDWSRIVGDVPDKMPSSEFGIGGDVPLYWVNFHEAESFASKLTQDAHRANALPVAWEFRLPTEAQWEYSCRAGTTTASAFGDRLSIQDANVAGDAPQAERSVRAAGRAIRVGSYKPNAWGIHDLHGNVWEWCRDWYHSRLPGGRDPDLYDVRGVPNRDGTYSRVRRGGAWIEPEWACRSACRLRYEPPRRSDHIGFRVVAVER